MLGTLDFTGSEHRAPFIFFQSTVLKTVGKVKKTEIPAYP